MISLRRLAPLLVVLPASCAVSPAPAPAPAPGAGSAVVETSVVCPAALAGLQDVTSTPAAPYFVHHPDAGEANSDTIVFIPGGPGSHATAETTFSLWLSRGRTLGKYRVIVPYSADGNLTDEGGRIVPVLDEVLGCYGGSASRVHLAGTSNGGRAAFARMLATPERFITLLGAPGLFEEAADADLSRALGGKAVFNGAGSLDTAWQPRVKATHERLVALGIDSVYVELPGEGHILSATADQEPFFAFWGRH